MSFAERLKAMLRSFRGGVAEPSGQARGEHRDSHAGPTGAELEAKDLEVLRALARCTACRACDVAFDGYAEAARPTFRGPSELVLSYARSFDEHGAAKRYVESLRRGSLVELERICPVGIPFVALADLVERRAYAIEPDEPVPEETRQRHDPG